MKFHLLLIVICFAVSPDARASDEYFELHVRPLLVRQCAQTSNDRAPEDRQESFWSFEPIGDPQIPIFDGIEHENPVDAFVARRYQQLGLKPGSSADTTTLIRRLTFDLTGLPPTPQEVEEFKRQSDLDSDRAYGQLIDRLLSSRSYGERWAQHWLDLVRYADTAGDASDFPIPEAYLYRNYVIDSFNDDKPYDEFVREQLAGDLISSNSSDESWKRTIATGYIALSRRIGVSPHGLRHITIEDTIKNVGKTFLGLSIGCARCHDHKFDPIPTSDYYALFGIFESTVYPHAGAEHRPYRSDFVYRIGDEAAQEVLASHRDELDQLRKKERLAFERYRDFQRKPINVPGYTRDVAWQEVLGIREEIRTVAKLFPELEIAFAVRDGNVGDAQIHQQGDPKKPGPKVPRGFLQVLGGQSLRPNAIQSGRLELANWIVDRENPLTARVMANRVWHHHFGRGLVASTSDFGVRGSKPSHPELLDYLARYLIDNDWSIKRLDQLVVSSRTYRLSSVSNPGNSTDDPENKFLWRAPRRRLDAEQLRDSILAFGGQLDRTPGGAHPFPHRLTYFYRQHEPFVGDFTSDRRSIYLFRQRIRKNPYLDMFDGPDGNLHIGARRPTTTSLQSLYFMNSEFVADQSIGIARHLANQSSSKDEQTVLAYRHIFGRDPNPAELDVTNEFLKKVERQLSKETETDNLAARSSMIRAMLGSNEFLFVD